jgi:hypothetical protein
MSFVGERAADARTPVIDGAAARFGIKKLAGLAKYRILFATQNPLVLEYLGMVVGIISTFHAVIERV